MNGLDLTFGGTGDQSPRPISEAVLIENWRADRDVVLIVMRDGQHLVVDVDPGTEGAQPACRCYRCGALLTVHVVKTDRGMVRPVCGPCRTGGYPRDTRPGPADHLPADQGWGD